jgi:hypothetical protein
MYKIPKGSGITEGTLRDREVSELTSIIRSGIAESDDSDVTIKMSAAQAMDLLFELRHYTYSDNDVAILRAQRDGARDACGTLRDKVSRATKILEEIEKMRGKHYCAVCGAHAEWDGDGGWGPLEHDQDCDLMHLLDGEE